MNVYQSIMNTSVLSLVLLSNSVSFGMQDKPLSIPGSKPNRIKYLSPELQEKFIDCLDNPITFGQTSKENHELVKCQGQRNICLAYKKNDPNFVLNHYVPILPTCVSITPKDTYRFDMISPYDQSFYRSEDENKRPKLSIDIVLLGKKRLQQFVDQKAMQYNYVTGSDGLVHLVVNSPLSLFVVLGSVTDITNKLNNLKKDTTPFVPFLGFDEILGNAMHARISNPDMNSDNQSLRFLLLLEERALMYREANESYKLRVRGYQYFARLALSRQTNNKQAFKELVTHDVRNSKNVPWINTYGSNEKKDLPKPKTALDLVLEYNEHCSEEGMDPFSDQDIALLRNNGAKTAQELSESQSRETCIIS